MSLSLRPRPTITTMLESSRACKALLVVLTVLIAMTQAPLRAANADTTDETIDVAIGAITENPTGLAEDPLTGEDVALPGTAPMTIAGVTAGGGSFTCALYPETPYILAPGYVAADVRQECTGDYSYQYATVQLQKKIVRKYRPDLWESVTGNQGGTYNATLYIEAPYRCPGSTDTIYRMQGSGRAGEPPVHSPKVHSNEIKFRICG